MARPKSNVNWANFSRYDGNKARNYEVLKEVDKITMPKPGPRVLVKTRTKDGSERVVKTTWVGE